MDGITTMPVTIIVKAPNQQIEDQTVHCELNWTIKKLKGHLAEVYPSKPKLEDQKLIYSGRLLIDSVQLKDVLRMYEGQENHTVHLVCSPPRDFLRISASSSTSSFSSSTPSPVTTPAGTSSPISASVGNNSINNSTSNISSSSSRQAMAQNIANATVGSREEQRPDGDPRTLWAAAAASAATATYPGTYNGNNVMAAHQMAWMQQAYSQYMSHYMQFLASTQGGVNNAYPIHTGFTAPTPQQQPAPARDENQPAANPAAGGENEEEEGRAHRDWLDWFYIMSRVTVLFSVVYFYSSPVRFFMVSTLGLIMYLYQVGFFRMQGIEARAENAAAAAAAGADRDQERENNNVPAAAAGDAAGATQQEGGGAAVPQAQDTERPSVLMLTWSIFCSFLLSLIPEQPNVI